MKIRDGIVRKYWREAAVEELALQYEGDGFSVAREVDFAGLRADLVAVRGDEKILIEVKTAPWTKDDAAQMKSLRNMAVHQLGAKFNLVMVAPPVERDIEIEDFEGILTDYLSNQPPNELTSIASRMIIEGVGDLDILGLYCQPGRISVGGEGVVEVLLEYGSSRDLVEYSDSFPLFFEIVLNDELEISEVTHLSVDTSSFWD